VTLVRYVGGLFCAVGSVLCDVTNPVQTATRFLARIVIFSINFPITKGFPVSALAFFLIAALYLWIIKLLMIAEI